MMNENDELGAQWPCGQCNSACDRERSVIRWVTKKLLSRVPLCFGRHVRPLIPAAFAVRFGGQSAPGPLVGYGTFSLCVIHKEGLCLSSGDINRLMVISESTPFKIHRLRSKYVRTKAG
jgi:hypothetical protein